MTKLTQLLSRPHITRDQAVSYLRTANLSRPDERKMLSEALAHSVDKFDVEAQAMLSTALRTAAPTAAQFATSTNPVSRPVTFTYDAGPHPLTNLKLNGSFDSKSGKFVSNWPAEGIAMQPDGNGKWSVTVNLEDDGQDHDWQWGVTADGPAGKNKWAVMGETNLSFKLNDRTSQLTYAPTTFHEMGVHRVGANDASFKVWSKNARDMNVKVTDAAGHVTRFPLTRDEQDNWSTVVRGQFNSLVGKSYVYEITDSTGAKVERADPYARLMMGEQRGLSRTYFDDATGKEVQPFFAHPKTEFMRFEIDNEPSFDSAYLVLKRADGTPLTHDQVMSRLSKTSATLANKIQAGRAVNDLGELNVQPDGRIKLTDEGGTWTTFLKNPSSLTGLRYELQVWEKDPQTGELKLHDDKNGDNALNDVERDASADNDAWSDVITRNSGLTFRGSVIIDPASFQWKHDSAPREKDHNKWVVYQMHVGSFLGKNLNSNRSTFEDITRRLDYVKMLGVNTIEFLPVNEVEGSRDWGYMGANSLAIESAYGFEDENGNWVTGTDALKHFIDAAHERGINVVNDVVYNHVGGDFNALWNFDGPENPYFNWGDPAHPELRDTRWGAMPAYDNARVKQFYVDHAVAQIEELHFDGLRFDFTSLIKDQGGVDGWNMMREMNRDLHFLKPEVFTVAEQFDYDPAISRPAGINGEGGAGMDAQWYTEFQHRLVTDNTPLRPGLLQAAARGWKTDVDAFMSLLTGPRGLDTWKKALTIISNHDEVGNGLRTVVAAEGDNHTVVPTQWARNAARFVAGIGLASPGIPIFFQGDESAATNAFRWGNPSTWDMGWSWETLGNHWNWDELVFNDDQRKTYERLFTLGAAAKNDSAYQALSPVNRRVFDDLLAMNDADRVQAMNDIPRKQSFRFFQDAIRLRKSSAAFDADAAVSRVYAHNDNSVMAFTRQKNKDAFLVVGSLNRQNLSNYNMELPPGRWEEVLNSDSQRYGGSNFGNGATTLEGGKTSLNIPNAGYVVFKKVG